MPDGAREAKSTQPRFACPAFGGVTIPFEGCQQVTTVSDRNEKYCTALTCTCPWRACKECVAQGTVSNTSRVVDPASGLCLRHGGVAVTVSPNATKAPESPSAPAHDLRKQEEIPHTPSAWQAIVARYKDSKVDESTIEPSLFELSDAITAMFIEGKSHAEINTTFGFTNSNWSPRLYALRYITASTRHAIEKLNELPPLTLLTNLAYTAAEHQVSCLQKLLSEREQMLERQRKDRAARTVRYLSKVASAAHELSLRVTQSGKDIEHPDDFMRMLDETIAVLHTCKATMSTRCK